MRLFLAWLPPAVIRQRLVLMMGGIAAARWQREDQLHSTVKYFGDADRHSADLLIAMLDRAEFALPALAINGVGQFARGARTDQLWAGVGPVQPLAALHHQVDRLGVRAGFAPESRNYVPHITLARFGKQGGQCADFLQHYAGLSSGAFDVKRLVLFESRISHHGSDYTALQSFAVEQTRLES